MYMCIYKCICVYTNEHIYVYIYIYIHIYKAPLCPGRRRPRTGPSRSGCGRSRLCTGARPWGAGARTSVSTWPSPSPTPRATWIEGSHSPGWLGLSSPTRGSAAGTPNLPTKITPIKIAWFKFSWKCPMCLGIPPLKLKIKIVLESNPLKSRVLARRLAVSCTAARPVDAVRRRNRKSYYY